MTRVIPPRPQRVEHNVTLHVQAATLADAEQQAHTALSAYFGDASWRIESTSAAPFARATGGPVSVWDVGFVAHAIAAPEPRDSGRRE